MYAFQGRSQLLNLPAVISKTLHQGLAINVLALPLRGIGPQSLDLPGLHVSRLQRTVDEVRFTTQVRHGLNSLDRTK